MKLLIIGAGPGGYEAAFRAAQLGNDVVLVEKNLLGGTCLNIGCIPTKTMVKIADFYSEVQNAEEFGVKVDGYSLDTEKIYQRKQDVMGKLRDGIEYLISTYDNIKLLKGTASFVSENEVKVVLNDGGEENVTFDKCIIATGSKDIKPLEGCDLPKVLNSTTLLSLKEIPKSMIVIGTGVIGLEFATIYASFGTEVTVIGNNMFKTADIEIQKRLQSILKNPNLKFATKQHSKKIEQAGDMLKVTTQMVGKDTLKEYEAEYVLVALGRASNTDGLNTEAAKVETKDGGVLVDENLKTSNDNIYAIGDVIYKNTQLAHFATAQGFHVVEQLSGLEPKTDLSIVPAVLYTVPELAQVGKTEQELEKEGIEYDKAKSMYQANGKALAVGGTKGFIKILSTKDHKKILGCHIIGKDADLLIHYAVIAMANGLNVEDLSNMIYAHPTIAEVFKDAIESLEGKSTNSPMAK